MRNTTQRLLIEAEFIESCIVKKSSIRSATDYDAIKTRKRVVLLKRILNAFNKYGKKGVEK